MDPDECRLIQHDTGADADVNQNSVVPIFNGRLFLDSSSAQKDKRKEALLTFPSSTVQNLNREPFARRPSTRKNRLPFVFFFVSWPCHPPSKRERCRCTYEGEYVLRQEVLYTRQRLTRNMAGVMTDPFSCIRETIGMSFAIAEEGWENGHLFLHGLNDLIPGANRRCK